MVAEWILLIELAVWEWSGVYSAADDFFKQQNYEMFQGVNEIGRNQNLGQSGNNSPQWIICSNVLAHASNRKK